MCDKYKDLFENVRNIVNELDPECPDNDAYIDGHCSLYELVMSKIYGIHQKKLTCHDCKYYESGAMDGDYCTRNSSWIDRVSEPSCKLRDFEFRDKRLGDIKA